MRLPLLLFVLGLVTTHALPSKWSNVFSSFFSKTEQEQRWDLPNYYGPVEPEPTHLRAKRAVFAALGFGANCEPGWTGKFCDSPICNNPVKAPNVANLAQLVENIFLPSGCTGKYYVPVDSSANLEIHVNAAGTPYVNITDSNGNVVTPTSQVAQDGYSVTFFDPITPGAYQLTINNGGVPTTDCIVEVNTYSNVAARQIMVMTPQDDMGPHAESGIENVPMFLATHIQNVALPGQQSVITVRLSSSTAPVYRATLHPRYGCGYEYYAGGFTCTTTSTYTYSIDGIDQGGQVFRRSGRFGCMLPITTSPAPTTTPKNKPPLVCLNNGTKMRPNTADEQCFCTELFTGPDCSQANCMNGGYLAPSGQECVCDFGYHGINCQSVTCGFNVGPFLTDFKTLIVAVRSTASMAPYIKGIADAIDMEVQDSMSDGSAVYRGFILTTFANGIYFTKPYGPSQYANFIADLRAVGTSTTNGTCADNIFDGLNSIFDQYLFNKSPFYIFTDAIATDVNGWRTITESNAFTKFPFYIFLMNQTGCNNAQPLAAGFQALEILAFLSGGLLYQPSNSARLATTFQLVLKSTADSMNTIVADDLQQCNTPTNRVFFADSSTQRIIIMGVGQGLILGVTDPSNQPNAAMQVFVDGMTYFWEVLNPQVGQYFFSLTSTQATQPCSIRINGQSQFGLFFATSPVLNVDVGYSEPVLGTANHIVAQLNGLTEAVKDPFKLFAEITITSNVNNEQQYQRPLYYSNGQYRDGCGFQLYFGIANFCQFADQMFYATIYADDNNGFTIQRTGVGYCSATTTTVAPPNSCQNGGAFDPTNNVTCICPAGFNGAHCERINCVNGGTPIGGFCQCVAGTAGTFCEMMACTQSNGNPRISFEGLSMAFVISARSTMQTALNSISDGIISFTRDIQAESPTWIRKWILIVVNHDGIALQYTTNVPSQFTTIVQAVAGNLGMYKGNETDCGVLLETGINAAAMESIPESQIYVWTDSDGPNETNVYLNMFTQLTTYRITLNLIAVTSKICNSGADNGGFFPQYLGDLTGMTAGFTYMTPSVPQMLPFITSFYRSGLSGQSFGPDCTQGQSFYVPIDGFTQSFTIATTGANIKSVVVTRPDGRPGLYDPMEIQLITEPELNLLQFMAECSQGWDYNNQYCYKFNPAKVIWNDAIKQCHQLGGYMVDVHNAQENAYILSQTTSQFVWLGLIRNGNSWIWDVPDGNQFQPLGSYQNWAPGIDPNTTTFNCVAQDGSGYWVPTACDTPLFPACMKARYGQGIFPGDPFSNLVIPGFWQVTVTTNSGGCYSQVRSQSEIEVFFGFVSDPHSDFPLYYANSDSSQNYLVAAASGLLPFHSDTNPSLEGRINYAVMGYNNTLTNAFPLQDRWQCDYSYVSPPFSCPIPDGQTEFFVKFSGVDQYGYTIERYTDTLCTPYVTNCFNGGFKNPINGLCQCPAGYTGSRCQTPLCQNDGIEISQKCNCPAQFTGTFCELPFCEPAYPPNFNDNGRTLAIILETSYNMGATIFQLKRNIKKSLDAIKNDPTTQGWFSNYILYPFDSGSNMAYWYPNVTTTNSDDIVAAIANMTTMSCPGPNPCSTQCPRPVLSVINQVLNNPALATPNSVILVVTRSSPEDYDLLPSMLATVQNSKAQINFILPAIDSPCSEGWTTPGAYAYYQLMQPTSGDVFVMSAVDFSTGYLQQYVPTLYKSGGLETGSWNNCTYQEFLFPVEHSMYEFTIDIYHPATNPATTVALYDPAQNQIPLPPNILSSDTNFLGIVKVNDSGITIAGTYRIVIQAANANYCQLNVRGRSVVEVYAGFVQTNQDAFMGATNDDAYSQPLIAENNTIVVHAAGLPAGGVMNYVQVVSPRYGLAHTTQLVPRDKGCSYEYYGTRPFECYEEHVWIIIYGIDEKGANIRRQYSTSCVSTRAPRPPPPPRCDLTAVLQDTLFIIDSSQKDSDATFKILKSFVNAALPAYSFTNGNMQVAAMTVSDIGRGSFSYNAGENSSQIVEGLVLGMTYDGNVGQNLTSALGLSISRFSTPAQGYRNSPNVRHNLIYITNTNPTDDDPASTANQVRRSGIYGTAFITYGITPSLKLNAIAGPRCIYNAADYNDLMSNGVNFLQGLSCQRGNFCYQ